MISMAAASLIGAGIAALAGVASSYFTNKSNSENVSDTNKANQSMNEANLQQQMAIQQTEWQRNDTAWQRGVADAEAAGLSPLAVTSGSSSGSLVGTPSSIPMQASSSQAISFDGIASMLMHAGDQYQQQKQFEATQQQENSHFQANLERDYDQMEQSMQQLEMQIASTQDENLKQRLQDAKHHSELLLEQQREFDAQYSQSESQFDARLSQERFMKMQDNMKADIDRATGGKGPVDYISDRAEYEAAISEYNRQRENFIEMHVLKTSNSYANGESSNTGFGLSTGLSLGSGSKGSSSSGSGSLGANASIGGSSSFSASENNSQYNQYTMDSFYMSHPYPYYVGDFEYLGASRR